MTEIKAEMERPMIYIGLTMWSHNEWQQSFYGKGTTNNERLERYASVFNTVEGNTTFYATPSPTTIRNWASATNDDFRFTFKLPKSITHDKQLTLVKHDLLQFLNAMEPVTDKVGLWTIQLPASFGPSDLGKLKQFCQLFPDHFPLAVEVRHPLFFAKGPQEKTLNRWLSESNMDRVIMDSRPLFAAKPENAVIRDAQQKKPKVPVHAIATHQSPMIRFIGQTDANANQHYFQPWIRKISDWVEQGKRPYIMIHTPDNARAPELAVSLHQQLSQSLKLESLAPFPALRHSSQISLF
jgi:uncharacterized protein YecE (DUF72 family)